MKKFLVNALKFATVVSFILIVHSCSKDETESTPLHEQYVPTAETQAQIKELQQLYKSSIIEVLSRNTECEDLKSSHNFIVEDEIAVLFNDKLESYFASKNLKNSSELAPSDSINLIQYQSYFDELAMKLNNFTDYAYSIDMEETEFISKYNDVRINFADSINSLTNLSLIEKQAIIDYSTIRTVLASTTIEYADEFADSSLKAAHLKGCGWICKTIRVIKCTTSTVHAVTACAVTISTSGATVVWCGVTTYLAYRCWSN